MTKKKQFSLCKALKKLYTKADKHWTKGGHRNESYRADLKKALAIEDELDKARDGVRWYQIYLAWEHGWKWSPYSPTPKSRAKR